MNPKDLQTKSSDGKLKAQSKVKKSDDVLKGLSEQKVENECKLKTKKTSNVKAKEPSSHADDAELLNKLVSVALENRNHLSEQEDEEVNDNCDYEDLDAFENDNSDSEEAAQIGDTSKTSKTRGLTKLLALFKMNQPIRVNFNKEGQPDCDNTAQLGSFLGLIARNGQVAPLNYVDWRAMPATFKNMQWFIIQRAFVIPPHGKKWVMMSLGRNWGNFKSKLKKKHYDVHDNDLDRIGDRDPRVHPDHWNFLVKHWSSDKGKERCLKNKNSRAAQKTMHTTGRKSFARIRKEMKKELKKEPKRHELFIRTHTRKNGEPMNKHSKEVINMIKDIGEVYPEIAEKEVCNDDLFAKVVGEDKHGRIRCYGLGPSPSDVWGAKLSPTECLRMLTVSQNNENKLKKELHAVNAKLENILQRMGYLEKRKKKKRHAKHSSNNSQVEKMSNQNDSPQREVQSSQSSHEVVAHEERKLKKIKIRHNRQIEPDTRTKVYLRSTKKPHGQVAVGTIVSKDPNGVVGGTVLGNQFWEVQIDVPKVLEEPLVRCYKHYTTIRDAIGITVTWPYTYVEEMVMLIRKVVCLGITFC